MQGPVIGKGREKSWGRGSARGVPVAPHGGGAVLGQVTQDDKAVGAGANCRLAHEMSGTRGT